jgi:hypothetical protein
MKKGLRHNLLKMASNVLKDCACGYMLEGKKFRFYVLFHSGFFCVAHIKHKMWVGVFFAGNMWPFILKGD